MTTGIADANATTVDSICPIMTANTIDNTIECSPVRLFFWCDKHGLLQRDETVLSGHHRYCAACFANPIRKADKL